MEDKKILIHLRAIGNAHILKVKKYHINKEFTFNKIKTFLKSQLLIINKPIFLYVKYNNLDIYYPESNEIIKNLYNKYKINNELQIYYSYYKHTTIIENKELITKILLNMEIIGCLQKSDKLIIKNDNNLEIIKGYYLQGIYRWVSGENRKKTLQCIKYITDTAFKIINSIILDKHKYSELLQKFLLSSKLLNRGIDYLKNTYIDDITTISILQLIQDKLNIKISKITSILKFNKP